MEQIVFYILAAVVVIATLFAVTERHPVHAIIYLASSFFGLAAIFYLLLAPLAAVFEVIIYAGAIMVLFLFVIMMLDLGHPEKVKRPAFRALVAGTAVEPGDPRFFCRSGSHAVFRHSCRSGAH